MRKLLIAVLLLAFVSSVEAARRWFVQTSDNKIISFTEDDNAPTPAGTIAVADAVIRTEDLPWSDRRDYPPGNVGRINLHAAFRRGNRGTLRPHDRFRGGQVLL